MSEFEVVSHLLGLYPIVINALNVYKDTKSTRAIAPLIHELKVEQIIYREFVHALVAPDIVEEETYLLDLLQGASSQTLWQDVTLNQKVLIRLGSVKAKVILDTLREIERLLNGLNSEFNISR